MEELDKCLPFVGAMSEQVLKQKRFRLLGTPCFIGVEDIGFEPTASCMPCKRSSQMS
jgi:hypothetical protein